MKRYSLLALFLVVMSMPAQAEWTKVGSGDAPELGQRTFYIDFASIEKSGMQRKVLELMDFSVAFNGARSIKTLGEFDCKNNTVRILTFTAYSENMSRGKIIYDDPKPRKIERIADDKIEFARLICSR